MDQTGQKRVLRLLLTPLGISAAHFAQHSDRKAAMALHVELPADFSPYSPRFQTLSGNGESSESRWSNVQTMGGLRPRGVKRCFPKYLSGLRCLAARRVLGGPACSAHGSAASTLRKCRVAAGARSAPKRSDKGCKSTMPGLSGIPSPPQVPRDSAEPPAGAPCWSRSDIAPTSPRAPDGRPALLTCRPRRQRSPLLRALRRHLASGRRRGEERHPRGRRPFLPSPSLRPPAVGEGGEQRCPPRRVLRVTHSRAVQRQHLIGGPRPLSSFRCFF